MRRGLLALGVFALVAVAVAADPPKKLGPEWTYDKDAQHHFKMVQIKAVRHEGGNVQSYYLDLEHDKVWVSNTDGNIATYVNLNQSLRLEVKKDPKGAANSVAADINRCRYRDLNCDGELDVWHDNRDNAYRTYIMHDSHWVRVNPTKTGCVVVGSEYKSFDLKTTYTWDGKVWNAKPAK